MPKFLVSGKGGGRTHLMRYYSYALRRSAAEETIVDQISKDGYLGIYSRCSGLNAFRFSGKGIEEDVWTSVFCYYMDLWLTSQLVEILIDISDRDSPWTMEAQFEFVRNGLGDVLDDVTRQRFLGISVDTSPLKIALREIRRIRRSMDREINNAAIKRRLEIEVRSNPGDLIFKASKAASRLSNEFSHVLFAFLLDEFENLSEPQQRYVNTLIREKVLPTTFLLGGRRWGVRTHRTLNTNEENKQGSEYEWVELEQSYRDTEGAYAKFCLNLTLQRVQDAGYRGFDDADDLRQLFSVDPTSTRDLADIAASRALEDCKPENRKHLVRLRDVVFASTRSRDLAASIVSAIAVPSSPMSEKFAIHRFYQNWSREGHLSKAAAREAADEIAAFRNGTFDTSTSNFVRLWKLDLLAQIYMDCGRRSPYLGIDRFIEVSAFLPRSYLMTMKYVVEASNIRGEDPFSTLQSVSDDAQMSGVLRASRWFLRDARPTEGLGNECERAIRRLATLFNRVRYSDKPAEVSCVSFSTDFGEVSRSVREVVEACVDYGLLLEVFEGRAARNDGSTLHKFQLSPMLCPIYALPTSRRGELNIKPLEMQSIFDPDGSDESYARTVRPRLRSMRAPFGEHDTDPAQDRLF